MGNDLSNLTEIERDQLAIDAKKHYAYWSEANDLKVNSYIAVGAWVMVLIIGGWHESISEVVIATVIATYFSKSLLRFIELKLDARALDRRWKDRGISLILAWPLNHHSSSPSTD
ncbi:hypothetical protein LO749_16790 [Paracoccus denitrificans]|uniref:hypothetical protein n=1 Tax=Paracoccus denitrificans TaxID=266 RepID=UPI001E42C095|nr:hypothetical protein [Paracoccus denitrificans]UFS67748.1 hypothetical protein LO749_16790 [Paracoccus denitrificans]